MLRIQVLVEDYAELMSLSTTLKKVGFDVESTQNPAGLADNLLRLNPDLLIMTAHGRRVAGFELAKQLKKNRGLPRVILLHEAASPAEADPAVEAWVASPVDGAELLTKIADACLLNGTVLLDKYYAHIAAAQPPPPGSMTAVAGRGRLNASTIGEAERRERYKKFLSEPRPATHGLATSRVRDQVKALRRDEVGQTDDDLEKERRDFVTQLFTKKTGG